MPLIICLLLIDKRELLLFRVYELIIFYLLGINKAKAEDNICG